MEGFLIQLDTITSQLSSKLTYKSNFSEQEISEFKQKLLEAGSLVNNIENAYYGLKKTERNDFKYKMDFSKSKYNLVNTKILKIESDLKKFNNKANTIKEPLIIDHNVRYNRANNDMSGEIKTLSTTNDDMNTGYEALVDQGKKLKDANIKLDNIDQNLTLHNQLLGVVKNKALFSKLKIYFIVLMFFFGDLLMLYIKLTK